MNITHKVIFNNVGGKLVFEVPDDTRFAAQWAAGMSIFLYQLDEKSFWLSASDESDVLTEFEKLLDEFQRPQRRRIAQLAMDRKETAREAEPNRPVTDYPNAQDYGFLSLHLSL